MNLLEAITYLRTNILDDTGGLGADWESFRDTDSDSLQLRWTNEELTASITESINQVYRRILPIKDSDPIFQIVSTVSVQNYSLDSRILQVLGVRDSTTGKILERLDLSDVWEEKDLFTREQTSTRYIPNYDTGTITFYPIPTETVTYNLLVYRLPLSNPDWNKNNKDLLLREEFIVPMLYYAAHICYDKDEANVLDPGRAVYFLPRFNQEFLMTSAYSDTRKRSTTNRTISYGGL